MMIPWIVGGCAFVLAWRWLWLRAKRRANDHALGAAIKNRRDVNRYLGDNE